MAVSGSCFQQAPYTALLFASLTWDNSTVVFGSWAPPPHPVDGSSGPGVGASGGVRPPEASPVCGVVRRTS